MQDPTVLSGHWVVKGPERRINKKEKRKEKKGGAKEHEAPNRADQMQLECREGNADRLMMQRKRPSHERESVEKRQWHGILY
jgi:hypothetical protein